MTTTIDPSLAELATTDRNEFLGKFVTYTKDLTQTGAADIPALSEGALKYGEGYLVAHTPPLVQGFIASEWNFISGVIEPIKQVVDATLVAHLIGAGQTAEAALERAEAA